MSNKGKQAKVQVFLKPYSLRNQDACSSLPSSLVKDWEVPDTLIASYTVDGWETTSVAGGAAKPEPFVRLGNPHQDVRPQCAPG